MNSKPLVDRIDYANDIAYNVLVINKIIKHFTEEAVKPLETGSSTEILSKSTMRKIEPLLARAHFFGHLQSKYLLPINSAIENLQI